MTGPSYLPQNSVFERLEWRMRQRPQSLVYLEEISEISPPARLTVRPRRCNLFAELLSQTKPGAEPRQAPRQFIRVPEAIERTVVDFWKRCSSDCMRGSTCFRRGPL